MAEESKGKSKYHIPDLSNATPGGLVDLIGDERAKKAEAEFYEKFYKQALEARKEGVIVEGERYIATFVAGSQERIDSDAVRAAFTREELIQRGFLKTIPMMTLKTPKRAPK